MSTRDQINPIFIFKRSTVRIFFHGSEHFIFEIMAAALCALFHAKKKSYLQKKKYALAHLIICICLSAFTDTLAFKLHTTSAGRMHVHRLGEKKGKQKKISEKFNN